MAARYDRRIEGSLSTFGILDRRSKYAVLADPATPVAMFTGTIVARGRFFTPANEEAYIHSGGDTEEPMGT